MRWFALVLVALGTACGGGAGPAEPSLVPDPAAPPAGDDATLEAPGEISLDHGEVRGIEGTALRIRFEDVLEDSRCPVDVDCIWQGNARVELSLGDGSGPPEFLLLDTDEPRSAEAKGVRVTLLQVSPEPVSTMRIPLEDYSVRLRVEPFSQAAVKSRGRAAADVGAMEVS